MTTVVQSVGCLVHVSVPVLKDVAVGVRSGAAGWVLGLTRGLVGVMVDRPRRALAEPVLRRKQRLRARFAGEPSRKEVLTLLRAYRGELAQTPREVLERAEEAGVSRRTLRRWLRRHGVTRLELSLEAGFGEENLRAHLRAGSLPPEWALQMLADGEGPVDVPSAHR